MSINPIQTRYKGYNFRSRLEARWAVFFDAIGLKWEYEVEGFVLSNGTYYLPDFKITSAYNIITWYDVKPAGSGDCEKMERLRKDVFENAINAEFDYTCFKTLQGDPYYFLLESKPTCINEKYQMYDKNTVCPRCGNIDFHSVDFYDNELYFLCLPCDFTTPCGGGHGSEAGIITTVRPHKGGIYVEDISDISHYHDKINEACTNARSARFEHGETPTF